MRGLLPPHVAVVETTFDELDAGVQLSLGEMEIVSNAVPSRQDEFRTGRLCAHRAMARLGADDGPVLRRSDGGPAWPPGVVGSITHCDGYRAAAVAWSMQISHIGIDAERHARIEYGAFALVTSERERLIVEALRRKRPELHWDCITFSAKESSFKALASLSPSSFTFADVVVRVEETGSFSASSPSGSEPGQLFGRWAVRGGLVQTAVAIEQRSSVLP